MFFMKILLWIILYPFLDAILVLNWPYFGLMTRFDDQVDDQVCVEHEEVGIQVIEHTTTDFWDNFWF